MGMAGKKLTDEEAFTQWLSVEKRWAAYEALGSEDWAYPWVRIWWDEDGLHREIVDPYPPPPAQRKR